ncbi:hypothetical protein F0562_033428 [Nyssa sinensis]|uniref:Uncharacterized protein n=1 Tax=Nyssa sinensis TaxID=561372 RepID=A0A5J5AFP4_9ASTE|nr:hypothetical protein F0562_033428 [Nyssa sinensis]
MKVFIAQFALFITVSTSLCSISARSPSSQDPVKFILGEENLGPWKNGILSAAAEAPGSANDGPPSTLVLAAKRTKRPDVLRGFRRYRGGWDITNKHYWTSVGFTVAAGFILARLWFVSFGLALLVHHCCGWRINVKGKGSHFSQRICLIMLIVFTCAAAIGCILLSVGQDDFHGEALHTLSYVVFLPSDVKDDIDKLNVDLNTAADMLTEKTNEDSGKIRRVFNSVRSALITVAAVMLLLSLLGLVLSVLGHQHAIHIFIISGWLLVAVTFVLCGVFVILDSAISDTCMAMGEWVDNPHAETALSDILPCVDQRTTNQTLIQNRLPQSNSNYYNQSGPLMPRLCYPYDYQLQDIPCTSQAVSMANASLVWENYTCTVSPSESCTSVGRLTPNMYGQLVAAVNICFALEHYTPPLLSFQDCNFVRDTFQNIASDYCPPLKHHLRMVNVGLALISVGVMLCLALWILYANRPQREEVFVKLSQRLKGSCNSRNSCNNNSNNDASSRITTPSAGV